MDDEVFHGWRWNTNAARACWCVYLAERGEGKRDGERSGDVGSDPES